MSDVVVALIVIPLLSAIVAAALGHERTPTVRWVALGSTAVSLMLTVGVAWEFAAKRYEKPLTLKKFTPEYETNFVVLPLEQKSAAGGDTPPAAIRFHIGI